MSTLESINPLTQHAYNIAAQKYRRVLQPGGYLLVAVEAGTTEGYMDDLLGIKTKIYSALFTQEEIANYFKGAGFTLEFNALGKISRLHDGTLCINTLNEYRTEAIPGTNQPVVNPAWRGHF